MSLREGASAQPHSAISARKPRTATALRACSDLVIVPPDLELGVVVKKFK